MRRRTLLLGGLALAGAQVACSRRNVPTLRLVVLKNSLPPQAVSGFRASQSGAIALQLKAEDTIANLFTTLQASQQAAPRSQGWLPLPGQRPPVLPHWVSLSDYWLAPAIQQNLIQPLMGEPLMAVSSLPDRWRSLVQRDDQGAPSAQGSLWAMPYRWGTLVMVYVREPFQKLGWEPYQWRDLWRPELQGRIALPDHPRLALGMALKSLGASVNHPNPKEIPGFEAQLMALRPQVKVYSTTDYLASLLQGDIWLAVGWSFDVRPVLEQYRQVAAVVPEPGTLLSADLWVRPAVPKGGESSEAVASPLDAPWLNFWWQPDTQVPMSLFSRGSSPRLLTEPDDRLPDALQPARLLLPSAAQRSASEFLEPLSPAAIAQYTALWEGLRGRE